MELGEIQINQSTASGRSAVGLTGENDRTYLYSPEEAEQDDDVIRRKDDDDDDEGMDPCVPKGLLAGFLVLAIIGGLIALVVVVKGDSNASSVTLLPDPEAYRICFNRTVKLNEAVSILCAFNDSHRNWTELNKAEQAKISTPEQVEYNVTGEKTDNDSLIEWTWDTNVTMQCPLWGWWKIAFLDEDRKPLYNTLFHVNVSEPALNVKVDSIPFCSMSKGCGIYDIIFVENSTNYIKDETKTCRGSRSYRTGTELECSTNETELDDLKCVLYDSMNRIVNEAFIDTS